MSGNLIKGRTKTPPAFVHRCRRAQARAHPPKHPSSGARTAVGSPAARHGGKIPVFDTKTSSNTTSNTCPHVGLGHLVGTGHDARGAAEGGVDAKLALEGLDARLVDGGVLQGLGGQLLHGADGLLCSRARIHICQQPQPVCLGLCLDVCLSRMFIIILPRTHWRLHSFSSAHALPLVTLATTKQGKSAL